ncbi:MAG: hypothetical protein H0V82_09500 [Candidatus Protochlamydia sp.]|nr:hypothetical protein [Candidatus Protochlamydia sp.]
MISCLKSEFFDPKVNYHWEQAKQSATWRGKIVHKMAAIAFSIPLIRSIAHFVENYFSSPSNLTPDNQHVPISVPSAPFINPIEQTNPTPQPENACMPPLDDTDFILVLKGFQSDETDIRHHSHGYAGEVQGNKNLRRTAAKITRKNVHALSLQALNSHRSNNFELNLIFKIKRFGHVNHLRGEVNLPSQKKVKLEGFSEAFTIPMLASSYDLFGIENSSFDQAGHQWIVNQMNQITTSDYIKEKHILSFSDEIASSNLLGPIGIGSGHVWHSVADFYFAKNFYIHCNRGEGCRMQPGITVYYLPNPELLTPEIIKQRARRQEAEKNQQMTIEEMVEKVGGIQIYYEPMSYQEVGNCTYTSMQAALFFLMAARRLLDFVGEDLETLSTCLNAESWSEAFKLVQPEFKKWMDFDEKMINEDFIHDAEEVKLKTHPHASNELGRTYAEALKIWLNKGFRKDYPLQAKVNQLVNDLWRY